MRSLAAVRIHHRVFERDRNVHSSRLFLCLSLFSSTSSAYILLSSSRSSSIGLPFSKESEFSTEYVTGQHRSINLSRASIPVLCALDFDSNSGVFFFSMTSGGKKGKVDVTGHLKIDFCPTHPHVSVCSSFSTYIQRFPGLQKVLLRRKSRPRMELQLPIYLSVFPPSELTRNLDQYKVIKSLAEQYTYLNIHKPFKNTHYTKNTQRRVKI